MTPLFELLIQEAILAGNLKMEVRGKMGGAELDVPPQAVLSAKIGATWHRLSKIELEECANGQALRIVA